MPASHQEQPGLMKTELEKCKAEIEFYMAYEWVPFAPPPQIQVA